MSDSSPPPSAASNDSVALEDPTKDTSLSYTSLRERMDRYMLTFDAFKTNAYEARVDKGMKHPSSLLTGHDCQ